MVCRGQTVSSILAPWGNGMVLLLPRSFVRFFHQQLGIARTNAVVNLLFEVLGEEPLRKICTLLERIILDPMRSGERIKYKLQRTPSLPLQARIEEATPIEAVEDDIDNGDVDMDMD
ncbi:hypothetical protein PV04_05615 [Phialophora macrospora]|uniref:Uncharacterized protein n=1 Tax=Phialophora macrospora TaxID=1851006 RepID=A0A0D2E5Y4_9EURO|nr:hypothetical protein PV04_05615 [Phialophora macrospora]